MPADYPAPIRRRQTRPGINNSTAPGAQLITIAAGDRFTPSNDDGSPPVGGFWSAHPGTATKDRSGFAQSWCTQKSNRVRLHGFVLDFSRAGLQPAAAPFS